MNRSEKTLVVLLRVAAVILLSALAPALMPFAWMKEIHRWLGMGELPDGPIMDYLTRSLSAMYAFHGVLISYLSQDVRRFLPVVKFMAGLGVAFGVGMFALDAAVDMPVFWTLSEGPFIIVLGGLMLWLARGVEEEAGGERRP